MISVLQSYAKELSAVFCIIFGFALNRIFRPRAKLAYSFPHAWTFLVDQPLRDEGGEIIATKQAVKTATISISNLGIEPAKNVEVTFNWKPPFLNVWPARHYTEKFSAHDRYTLTLDSLAPGENFGVEIMSINVDLPQLTSLRSENSTAVQVSMVPQVVQPVWKSGIALILMVAGVGALGYALAGAVEFMSSSSESAIKAAVKVDSKVKRGDVQRAVGS